MGPLRISLLALLSALVLAAGGCGADDKGSAAAGASLVPKGAPAFVGIDSSLDSDQWKQVRDLVRKFPDGQRAIDMLKASFEEDSKLDWERDVKPALGDEIDIVWLDFEADGENVVALTKPDDKEKLRKAVAKANAEEESGDEILIGELDDWFVLSDEQAKIDRFKRESGEDGSLEDDQEYEDAVGELPADRLVTVFARGDDLLRAIQRASGIPGSSSLFELQGIPQAISAALSAEGDGFQVVGSSRAAQEPKTAVASYESKLLPDVPADALAFITFRGGDAFEQQLRQLEQNEDYLQGLRELERMLGFRIDRITRLFENEVGFYMRPGTPLPEFTLLLEAPDPQEALDAVDDVFQRVRQLAPDDTACTTPGGKCIRFGSVTVRYAAVGKKVVVTSGPQGLDEVRSGGDRLPDSDAFKEAADAAGLPDETAGFAWVDVQEVVPMILGFAETSGEQLPPEVRRNLEPLQSLVAWTTVDGRLTTAKLFLGID